MGFLDWLLGRSPSNGAPAREPSVSSYTDSDVEVVAHSASRLVEVINESIELATNSKSVETRLSRLGVAKDKLALLRDMVRQYPFLKFTSLAEVEAEIASLETEFQQRDSDAGARGGNGLVFRLSDDALYEANADILDGIEFMAALQLRTHLAVLEHHGEVSEGSPSAAPRYGSEADGIWVPKMKSWSQMGFDGPGPQESTCASEIGPVKPSVYLPFLKAFRRVVEADTPHEDKLTELQQLGSQSASFAEIWGRLQKTHPDFPHSFFYFRLTELPGVGGKTARNLYRAGFRSLQEVLTASREALLAVPGIGRGTVDKIRALADTREPPGPPPP